MAKARTKKRAAPTVRVWQWKTGARFGVKPGVAGLELERIRLMNSGALTPDLVVEAAASTRSPLHKLFNWDDTEAAHKYREWQARSLLNSIRVVVKSGDAEAVQQVAFISVVTHDTGRAYLPASVVLSDRDLRTQALAEAWAALEGWQRRYSHLHELADVFDTIARARPKVKKKVRAATKRAAKLAA